MWTDSLCKFIKTNLSHKILDDSMLRHLWSNYESPFNLLFNAAEKLLILICGKAFRTCIFSSRQQQALQ